jgi:hypothetical protein
VSKPTELRRLAPGSPLRVQTADGPTEATFHKIDGMYSLCTVADGRIFHLKAWTPMVEVDGRWEIARAAASTGSGES